MLCAGGNLDDRRTFERRDFDFSTHGRRNETDRHVAEDVVALARKEGMRLDGDRHIQVSRRPRVDTVFTFVGEAEPHAGFDAGRNVHGNRPFLVRSLPALAGGAGLGDDPPGSFALAAWTADAKKTLLEPDLSHPFAARAGLHRCGGLGAGAFAVAAGFPAGDLEFRFLAVDRFFEGEFEVVLEVVAAFRPVAAALPAEEILEDVVEDVAESAAASEVEPFESAAAL